jgi:glutamine synthetase
VGADVNPYLAMAACLASGLYGIRKKMKLKQACTSGNGYIDHSNGNTAYTLSDATNKMKESGIAEELFGKSFTSHFIQSREWEWRQHLKVVSDWELKRYFEII